jgi:hypothetical protein
MKLDSVVELWRKWNDDWWRSLTSRDVEKRGIGSDDFRINVKPLSSYFCEINSRKFFYYYDYYYEACQHRNTILILLASGLIFIF